MLKGFLHTSRYSYYDIAIYGVAVACLSNNHVGSWVIVTIIWLLSAGLIDLYYKNK